MAAGRQAPFQLCHDAVDLRQVLQRPTRQRAVELGQRLGGGQALGPVNQAPFELTAQEGLEAPHRVAVQALAVLVAVAALNTQVQRAPDPLDVHADHAGALALAAEGRHREPREVAHLAVVALPDRSLDLAPEIVEVDALAPLEAGLLQATLHRLRLDGAKEEAVEHQLEHAPVLL